MLRFFAVGGAEPTEEDLLEEAGYTENMIVEAKQISSAQLACTSHAERARYVVLRIAFAMSIMKSQKDAGVMMLPPCTWCGQPTGCYCDECYERGMRGRAICTHCDDVMPGCRVCFPYLTYSVQDRVGS